MLFDVIVHMVVIGDYCVPEFLLQETRVKILHVSFFTGHFVAQLGAIQANRHQCLFLRINQIIGTGYIDTLGFL